MDSGVTNVEEYYYCWLCNGCNSTTTSWDYDDFPEKLPWFRRHDRGQQDVGTIAESVPVVFTRTFRATTATSFSTTTNFPKDCGQLIGIT